MISSPIKAICKGSKTFLSWIKLMRYYKRRCLKNNVCFELGKTEATVFESDKPNITTKNVRNWKLIPVKTLSA